MATSANASDQASNAIKTVDASLWWDSFSLLLTELENVSLSSNLPPPLEKKLKANHAWFLDTINQFKPPNQKSRDALDSKQVKIGSHQLTIQPALKDAALKTSSMLCLDEVQSYIIVERSAERSTRGVDSILHEFHHLVTVQYYIERQCLLKCTRQILMHALYVGSRLKEGHAMWEKTQKLMFDGLESRLLSVLENLLSSNYPEQMDVDLYALWAEETLIEDNLVLDMLFLSYYESFCTCSGKHWKKLLLLYEGVVSGSFNLWKLSMSAETSHLIYYSKVQLLLILIETLDLENLLQMIHDETPFRQGSIAFSMADVQEIDAIVSGIVASRTREAGPLILSRAVFLCLISSLPGKEENYVLMEIDHVTYVRQATEAASLSYFLEILDSNMLKESDLEDDNLKLILDILCKIYRGEESLRIQFWDRESFVDGPIRCLLCNLEGEFPFRVIKFVRLLSALSEGAWPAECVLSLTAGVGGYTYLLEPLWWTGMITMIVGEVANFVAYIYAPAVLVTPLGALSIIVSAVLAHFMLKERLQKMGLLGCISCIVGSVVIVIHAPQEHTPSSPQYGQSDILVYLGICSLMGSLKALDIFDAAIVSPIYYVLFTTSTIIASVIMFKEWSGQDASSVASEICGFIIVLSGTIMLHSTREQEAANVPGSITWYGGEPIKGI